MSGSKEFWIRVPSGGIGHDTITNVAIESQWENEVHVIEYSAYEKLKAENQRLQKQFEKETLVTSSLYQQIELLQKNWELRADAFLKLEKENAKLLTAGRGLCQALKQCNLYASKEMKGHVRAQVDDALAQFGKVFADGEHEGSDK